MAIGDKTSVVMETTLATEEKTGIMQYATDEEATLGKVKDRAITPVQLRNTFIQQNAIQQFQQLSLPMSSSYNDTSSEWEKRVIPPLVNFRQNACIIGDKAYTMTVETTPNTQIGVRNLTDMSVEEISMSNSFPNGTSLVWTGKLFEHNGELHMFCTYNPVATPVNSKIQLRIYRVDLVTKSFIQVNSLFPTTTTQTGNYPVAVDSVLSTQIFKVTDDEYIFVTCSEQQPYYVKTLIFNFKTSTFTLLYSGTLVPNYTNLFAAVQKLPDGNVLLAQTYNSGNVLRVLKIFIDNYTVTQTGTISLGESNITGRGRGVQLNNNKMFCVCERNLPGGNYTFELDLENLTFDLSKYPNTLSAVAYGNIMEYNDTILNFINNSSLQQLKLQSIPVEDNPLVLRIFKGQRYNSVYKDVHVKALAEQEAFDILKKQQVAPSDLEIHLGQYDLDFPTSINIESGV